MAVSEFFRPEARARVRRAVEHVERVTSAEIVVAIRKRAGSYLAADLGWGAIVAFAALAFIIYAPQPFAPAWIPPDVALVFVLAALFSWQTPTLRRLLCSSRRREENVRRAALEFFHQDKLSRTSGRNAILIVVGVFERRAAVIHDIGVDPEQLGQPFRESVERIERSVRGLFPRLEDLALAVEALGPALADAMPRRADDVNELPDELEAD